MTIVHIEIIKNLQKLLELITRANITGYVLIYKRNALLYNGKHLENRH